MLVFRDLGVEKSGCKVDVDCLVASGYSDRQRDAEDGGGWRRRVSVSFGEVWLLETAND